MDLNNLTLDIWLTIIVGACLITAVLVWILKGLNSEKQVKCDWCGNLFLMRRREYKYNRRKKLGNYCSDKCRRIESSRRIANFT